MHDITHSQLLCMLLGLVQLGSININSKTQCTSATYCVYNNSKQVHSICTCFGRTYTKIKSQLSVMVRVKKEADVAALSASTNFFCIFEIISMSSKTRIKADFHVFKELFHACK